MNRGSKRRPLAYWVALMVLIFVGALRSALWPTREARMPRAATQSLLRTVAGALDARRGRLPGSLGSVLHEVYHSAPGDTILFDGWHNPVLYIIGPNAYELRSAGRDGRYYSGDDLVITGHPGLRE